MNYKKKYLKYKKKYLNLKGGDQATIGKIKSVIRFMNTNDKVPNIDKEKKKLSEILQSYRDLNKKINSCKEGKKASDESNFKIMKQMGIKHQKEIDSYKNKNDKLKKFIKESLAKYKNTFSQTCFAVHQGFTGNCWMVSTMIVLTNAIQLGLELPYDIRRFLYKFKDQNLDPKNVLSAEKLGEKPLACPKIPTKIVEIYTNLYLIRSGKDVSISFDIGGSPDLLLFAFLTASGYGVFFKNDNTLHLNENNILEKSTDQIVREHLDSLKLSSVKLNQSKEYYVEQNKMHYDKRFGVDFNNKLSTLFDTLAKYKKNQGHPIILRYKTSFRYSTKSYQIDTVKEIEQKILAHTKCVGGFIIFNNKYRSGGHAIAWSKCKDKIKYCDSGSKNPAKCEDAESLKIWLDDNYISFIIVLLLDNQPEYHKPSILKSLLEKKNCQSYGINKETGFIGDKNTKIQSEKKRIKGQIKKCNENSYCEVVSTKNNNGYVCRERDKLVNYIQLLNIQ